jgi:hypothetical protein
MIISKELLIEMLRQNELTVKFTKTDGTIRDMRCTLKKEILSELFPIQDSDEEKTEKKVRTPNPNVISVVDLEKKEWRSFKFDTILEVGIYHENLSVS